MESGAEREGSEEEGGEGGRELRVQVPTVHIAAARSRGEPADVIGSLQSGEDSDEMSECSDQSQEYEYLEGTHYSLSTVFEEDPQDVTGAESLGCLSPPEDSSNKGQTTGAQRPSHQDSSGLDISSSSSSQVLSPLIPSLSSAPNSLNISTIEAHDLLLAEESAGWAGRRIQEAEGFAGGSRPAVGLTASSMGLHHQSEAHHSADLTADAECELQQYGDSNSHGGDHFRVQQVTHVANSRSIDDGEGAEIEEAGGQDIVSSEACEGRGQHQSVLFSTAQTSLGARARRTPSFKSKPPASLDIRSILMEEAELAVEHHREALETQHEAGQETESSISELGAQAAGVMDAAGDQNGPAYAAAQELRAGQAPLSQGDSEGESPDSWRIQSELSGSPVWGRAIDETLSGLVRNVASLVARPDLRVDSPRGQSRGAEDGGDGTMLAAPGEFEEGERLDEDGNSFYGMAGGAWNDSNNADVSINVLDTSSLVNRSIAAEPTIIGSAASSTAELPDDAEAVEGAEESGGARRPSLMDGRHIMDMSRSFKLVAEGSYDVRTVHQIETEKKIEAFLEPHVNLLLSTSASISSSVHLSFTAVQEYGSKVSAQLLETEGYLLSLERAMRAASMKIQSFQKRLDEREMQLLKMTEERNIAEAMSQASSPTRTDASVLTPGSLDQGALANSPSADDADATPKDVSKITDVSASELQRMKNKLQHVNSEVKKKEAKIENLERSLATSQNLARQREEEIERLQDKMYESEADARRKIEKLTTYTQNLIKAVEKKELERDQKKAEILLLHQKLDEKEKEVERAKAETKDERVRSRQQLLVVENDRRKCVETLKATQAELSVTQTDTSKKIASLEATRDGQLDEIEELNKTVKLRDIQIEANSARESELAGGSRQAQSRLAHFVDKAIDADKQATGYRQRLEVAEQEAARARQVATALRKNKFDLEAQLREALHGHGEVQHDLNRALSEIDSLKVALIQTEREWEGSQVLCTNFQKKNAALQDLDVFNTAKHTREAEEQGTRITTLESKLSIAEMREEHLLKQMQEVVQTRDILSKDLYKCSTDLYAAHECTDALRKETDALQRILAAKQVLEKGQYNRTLHLEKTVTAGVAMESTRKQIGRARAEGRGGIPYKMGGESRSVDGGILRRVGTMSKKNESENVGGDTSHDNSFFQGESTVLSTVSSGGRGSVSPLEDGSSAVARGEGAAPGRLPMTHQALHGVTKGPEDKVGERRFTPRPPSAYSRKVVASDNVGCGTGSEDIGRERAVLEREGGPRASRLQPIAVSEAFTAGNGSGGSGTRRGLGQVGRMVSDDVQYLQRLVRGEV